MQHKKRRRNRIDPFMAAMRSATAAQLRYVRDDSPGVRRLKSGRGCAYRDAMGAPVTDKATRARIRALVIPPAWTDVWICSQPNDAAQPSCAHRRSTHGAAFQGEECQAARDRGRLRART
ncbi:MAG: hypothetical protein ACT4P6_17935 [Gemmatimonadaceae bacterium]